MENQEFIAVEVFCSHHRISVSFIDQLHASGLLQVTNIEQKGFVSESEWQKLEQLVRMHYELDINLEGLEVVSHMLDRITSLQSEIVSLKNRLRRFEAGETD
jgi:hypothetical protein